MIGFPFYVARIEQRVGENKPVRNNLGNNILSIVLGIGFLAAFGYFVYFVFRWLFSDRGIALLFFGLIVGLVYFFSEWLPRWMSKRTGQTVWDANRSIGLAILFVVGAVVGAYGVPSAFHLEIAWYWRLPLALAVGILALKTRRYR